MTPDRFRKSAVAILLTRAGGDLRVLVGRRSERSRFLGGFVAFPGGVHEAADGDLTNEDEAVCLRRTAARELREETGIALPPESFRAAGRRMSPPFTPVRFDSLMFAAFLDEAPRLAPESAELDELSWERPQDLVRRWRALEIRVAPPLLPMLHALAGLPHEASFEEIARSLVAANTFPDDEGPRIEFVPDVLMLPQRTRTLPPATTTNCFLIGAREILVVDPGSDEEIERTRLLRQLARRAAEGARPIAIALTHSHGDHVGGVRSLAAKHSLPVWAHPETLARCQDVTAGAPTRELADGEVLALAGGERVRVVYSPGHASGHVALFEETRGSLFAGDLVSGVSTVLVDTAPGALDAYLASVRKLRDLPARTLFPAHGPPMIDPPRALQALLDHRAAREARILEALASGPLEMGAIVRRAYEDTPGADPSLAARQALVHLVRLEEHGRVQRAGDGWALVS